MAKEKNAKKTVRTQIADKLATEFADLKANVDEKKFNKNIKKASKNLTAGYTKVKVKVQAKAKAKKKAAAPAK